DCEKDRPVLFFGGDYDITLTARLWPRIRNRVCAVTPPETASAFNDKASQVALVERLGVTVPRTRVLQELSELASVSRDLRFPLIGRPVELARRGRFAGKLFVARDEADLRARLEPVFSRQPGADTVSEPGEVLLQEYIPGGNDQLYFALASCTRGGEVAAMVTGRKLYEYPEGLMCIGETVHNSDLSDAARAVFRAFALPGVLGVEFKYDAVTRRFYFIEVNFRPENILAIAEGAGINLMFHAYLYALGREGQYRGGHLPGAVHSLWRDRSLVVLSRLSGAAVPEIPRKGRSAVDAYWSRLDPLPALAWYGVKLFRLFRARLRTRVPGTR
ncbi:MAG: ATP-grasp domain-containing protein, partial [Oleiphilaceae bacterium]|nr:ATP-grasp domain-containing protein [Oleiphilaceae bacterium]